MVVTKREVIFKGVPVSGGVAIGRLHYLCHREQDIPEFSITLEEIDGEIERFRKAIAASRHDLKVLQSFLEAEGSAEAVSIIDSHIQMLEDPLFTTFVAQQIKELLLNTETVFRNVVQEYERQFSSKNSDQFFRQRLLDFRDLSNRILRHLYPKGRETLSQIPEGAIVFAKELVPSDTAEASSKTISGFVTQIGGETSHAALIARVKGIPFVASIDIDSLQKMEGEIIIVDAETGEIILYPTDERLAAYANRADERVHDQGEDLPAVVETRDGFRIEMQANIETISDLKQLHHIKASGIGLFRTEFLFPPSELPSISEEEQFELYRNIITEVPDLPIVFRFFDVGGDKRVDFSNLEPNPALGCRSIRYLMRHKEIFSRQARALLRASIYGDISLLFPLITDVSELMEAKKFVTTQHRSLRLEGYQVGELPKIGSMIEVPSAALTCDHLAEESDFFSIGTNDLVQYTLASDRLNPEVNDMYKPAHPSLLRLIRWIVTQSGDLPISFCGEMASDLRFTELLLGLGVRKFSCAPRFIPAIKKKISSLSISGAEQFAQQMLNIKTSQELLEAMMANKTASQ